MVGALLVVLLQLAATPPQEREAEQLVHESIKDYDLGLFEKALHEAEDAYRLVGLPKLLFNIGQCHRALKHWEKAQFFFERYLQKLPDAPNRPLVERLSADVGYRLSEEQRALPPPAPAPATIVVVAAAPPPAVPVAAVEAPAVPPRSHTTTWVLGSVAVACVAVAIVGLVEVEGYESLRSQLATEPSYTQWQRDKATVLGEASGAATWEAAAISTGAAALATGTAAVLTW